MKRPLSLPIAGLALLLGACTAAAPERPALAPMPAQPGLAPVLGQNAAALVRLFGQPDADVREGDARKLQFASAICVLDAYLYRRGGEEARVTWIDTRERDGSPIDRASCIAALTRREGGR